MSDILIVLAFWALILAPCMVAMHVSNDKQ
jgi:hypothetical protein